MCVPLRPMVCRFQNREKSLALLSICPILVVANKIEVTFNQLNPLCTLFFATVSKSQQERETMSGDQKHALPPHESEPPTVSCVTAAKPKPPKPHKVKNPKVTIELKPGVAHYIRRIPVGLSKGPNSSGRPH